MYINFRCYQTGGHGRMYFRSPLSKQEILSVCEWFSRLNDDKVVIATTDTGLRVAVAGGNLKSWL